MEKQSSTATHNMSLSDAQDLAKMILQFGNVYRVTQDATGRTESDTTHTVMLSLLAGEYAIREAVPLDREAVVSMALIHDLVEVEALDTSTLRELSPDMKADKARREANALVSIRERLAGFPWLLSLLERYEAQSCLESRFIRYMDKVMPKLTQYWNNCKVPKEQGMTLDELHRRYLSQCQELSALYPEFHNLRLLHETSCLSATEQWGA